jgi:heterodisulfide reductase subunit A
LPDILVIGGGFSGCTAALELAQYGFRVTIVEKSQSIGGKVRHYGCKATNDCLNCGVCLANGLWKKTETHPLIAIYTNTAIVDLVEDNSFFSAICEGKPGSGSRISRFSTGGFSAVIIAVGFERAAENSFGNLELKSKNIITGFDLEKLLLNRNGKLFSSILAEPPGTIAFVQCFGSRDIKEKAFYCSRVCCVYAARMARAIKYLYPETHITFFYMDLQFVDNNQYFREMSESGFEFIRSRPIKIMQKGETASLEYENPEGGGLSERGFDLVVLSEGVRPASDSENITEFCALGLGENGFLREVMPGAKTGVYVIGCASGPKKIEECHAEAVALAGELKERYE